MELRDGGIVLYQKGFLEGKLADELLSLCLHGVNEEDGSRVVPWKQDTIVVGQRSVLEPR
jgi:hypothetical protein